ncbi:hypothetical protein SAY86_013580 [Trapa natans]|uniref:DUF7653 domain-containing protein n=1 Tax=Trapa natans TaxID=22666 RepID=A0AAN7KXK6_TRANT|nr:hypothetical protein SAY86_013580 [Trapa natans]
MRKVFFFRTSGSGNSTSPSTKKTQKEDIFRNRMGGQIGHKQEHDCPQSPQGLLSKAQKHSYDIQHPKSAPDLRRSHSLSSTHFFNEGLEQSNVDVYMCQGIITSKKKSGAKQSLESQCDSSEYSSNTLSNISSKIVDRYIDGEQNQDRSSKNDAFMRNIGKECWSHTSQAQFLEPSSPTGSTKNRLRSHSSREAKRTLYYSSVDLAENHLGYESPSPTKNVIGRHCQPTAGFPRMSQKDYDPDIPITVEDIYCGSLNKEWLREVANKDSIPLDATRGTISYEVPNHNNNIPIEDDLNFELQRRCKEAEERVNILSEEFEQDPFILDMSHDQSVLIHTIRNLSKEKLNLAMEVSELLQSTIAERASAKKELRLAKMEIQLQAWRLEREKKDMQLGFEKELDRRSSELSSRIEKYQFEEQRLHERVRQLAEQNVSLQREISSFCEREAENRNLEAYSEQQIKELSMKVEKLTLQNEELCVQISELQEKCKDSEENGLCIMRNMHEKEKESKELHRSVSRLLRTINDQGKTIEGFREGFSEEIGKLERIDECVAKLRIEQMRLTGVELALRQECESYRLEAESLLYENINLSNRLKVNPQNPRDLMFQLHNELLAQVCCLQRQGLSILNDSTDLCLKLLAFIRVKSNHHNETLQGLEKERKFGSDSDFLIESDVKIQGFKHGIESLTRSLKTTTDLLQVKHKPPTKQLEGQTSEDALWSELKTECLLTSLLKEKLYSKEMEIEQLQAELATAVRGADMLRSEVWYAHDSLSCVTQKLQELELQMLKKDVSINHLQNDLQDTKMELNIIRGILTRVSEERDKMWEKVKDFSEKNMLLNLEVDMLKRKADSLEEDVLIKEGQITILKDMISEQSFSLLFSVDMT